MEISKELAPGKQELTNNLFVIGSDQQEDCAEIYFDSLRKCPYNVIYGSLSNINVSMLIELNKLIAGQLNVPVIRIDMENVSYSTDQSLSELFATYFKGLKSSVNPKTLLVHMNEKQLISYENDYWGEVGRAMNVQVFLMKSKADISAQRLATI